MGEQRRSPKILSMKPSFRVALTISATLLCCLSLKLTEGSGSSGGLARGEAEKCDNGSGNGTARRICIRSVPSSSPNDATPTPKRISQVVTTTIKTTTDDTQTKIELTTPKRITQSTTKRPKTVSTTTPGSSLTISSTSRQPDGLITRTTDAFYRALSNVFTYEDERLDDGVESTTSAGYGQQQLQQAAIVTKPPSTKTPTSTLVAPIKTKETSTTLPASSTGPSGSSRVIETEVGYDLSTTQAITTSLPVDGGDGGETDDNANKAKDKQSAELTTPGGGGQNFGSQNDSKRERNDLLGFMSHLMRSISSFRDYEFSGPNGNRSTRLAPEPEMVDFGLQSGKLVLGPDNQPATSEDLHLLCKLLHRHFNNSTTNDNATTIKQLEPTGVTSPSIPLQPATATMSPHSTVSPTATAISATTTTSGPGWSSSSQASGELFVASAGSLDSSHESHLLESVFDYDLGRTRANESAASTIELNAASLMMSLYSEAAKLRDASGNNNTIRLRPTPPNGDYESDEPAASDSAGPIENSRGQLALRTWAQATRRASSKGHLHLLYWLLERSNASAASTQAAANLRVVNASEAMGLLDLLDHGYIKRLVEAAGLRPVQLVGPPFNNSGTKEASQNGTRGNNGGGDDDAENLNHHHHHQHNMNEPHVIDDTLRGSDGEQQSGKQQPASGLTLLVEKLTGASFTEHLHLYLILFLLALLIIILCFAVPLICCKSPASPFPKAATTSGGEASSGSGGTSGRRERHHNESSSSSAADHPRDPFSQHAPFGGGGFISGGQDKRLAQLDRAPSLNEAQKASDSIWRKLSTTTTTLVRDQSHLIRSDGTMPVSVIREPSAAEVASSPKRRMVAPNDGGRVGESPFEWYSFEDRLEQLEERRRRDYRDDGLASTYLGKADKPEVGGYTLVSSSDKRSITKSVQTSIEQQPQKPRQLEFAATNEARSSDTLTKSELVMLKEKLVPIGQQQQQQQHPQKQATSQPGRQTVASQTRLEPRDYVNQSAATEQANRLCDRGSQTDLRDRNNHELSSLQMSDELQMDMSQGPAAQMGTWRPAELAATSVVGFIDSPGLSLASGAGDHHTNRMGFSSPIADPHQATQTSATSGAPTQPERRPKMRNIELPPKARSKVDAIRAELGRLEQHRQPGGDGGETYRRYDI